MRSPYLDYNATRPIAPHGVEVMLPYLVEHFGNPSSARVYGRQAAQAVDPVNTLSPGCLSTGMDSPVTVNWSTKILLKFFSHAAASYKTN